MKALALFTAAIAASVALPAIMVNDAICSERIHVATLQGEACDFITGRSRSFTPDTRLDRDLFARACAKAEALRAAPFPSFQF